MPNRPQYLRRHRFRYPYEFVPAEHAARDPVGVSAGTPVKLIPSVGGDIFGLQIPAEGDRLRRAGEHLFLPVRVVESFHDLQFPGAVREPEYRIGAGEMRPVGEGSTSVRVGTDGSLRHP